MGATRFDRLTQTMAETTSRPAILTALRGLDRAVSALAQRRRGSR